MPTSYFWSLFPQIEFHAQSLHLLYSAVFMCLPVLSWQKQRLLHSRGQQIILKSYLSMSHSFEYARYIV